jgi:hypothetical protein
VDISNTITRKPAWSAIAAIALGVAGLIIAEFLPVYPLNLHLRIRRNRQ